MNATQCDSSVYGMITLANGWMKCLKHDLDLKVDKQNLITISGRLH
jgi:hypothetical protein